MRKQKSAKAKVHIPYRKIRRTDIQFDKVNGFPAPVARLGAENGGSLVPDNDPGLGHMSY